MQESRKEKNAQAFFSPGNNAWGDMPFRGRINEDNNLRKVVWSRSYIKRREEIIRGGCNGRFQ